jgi:hypothetical protein
MTMTEKQPSIYNIERLYTFDAVPEGEDGEPNIFGGHAHSGKKRIEALRRFASGDTSVIVYEANEYSGSGKRVEDPTDVHWPSEYLTTEEDA